jgi:flagellar biosynthesis protein
MSSSSDTPTSGKRKVAVALRYRRDTESAPTVVAGGFGLIAERILALAVDAKVPVHEDAALAEALGKVGVDRPIPNELYEAVAEVIAFVYRLRPEASA